MAQLVTRLALLDRVAHHADARPSDLAYREAAGGRTLTWRELADRVRDVAALLKSHLPSAGVVLLCAANQIEYPIAFLGILAAGWDVFPVSADIAEPELLRAAEQSAAVALIGQERAIAALGGLLATWSVGKLISPVAPFDVRHHLTSPGGRGTGGDPNAERILPKPGDNLLLPPDFGELSRVEEGGDEGDRQTASNIDCFTPSPGTPGEGRGEGRPAERNAASHRSPPAVRPHPNPLPAYREREPMPALLLQSSGTTGLPKIVRRSGRSLDAVSAAMAAAVHFTAADHVLATVPLTHSYGLEHGLLAPVWAGSTVHLCRGLDVPTVLGELAGNQITIFPAVPAVFEMLAGVSDAPAITSLRTAYSAGAPLPASVTARFAARFNVRVAQLYGATEIGSVTFNSPHEEPFAPASVGNPMAGVEIRILDVTTGTPLPANEDGHVAIRAESMFDGYLASSLDNAILVNAPHDPNVRNSDSHSHRAATTDSREMSATPDAESSASHTVDSPAPLSGPPASAGGNTPASRTPALHADLLRGFFPTGDLGHLDATGRLFITGRLKLLIDVGGMKVNPIEVENVLREHAQVGDCVVFAIRQSETVSRIKAIIVPREPSSVPAIEELRAFAKSRLSAYKVPRVFEIRDALPRSATGKILRQVIEAEG